MRCGGRRNLGALDLISQMTGNTNSGSGLSGLPASQGMSRFARPNTEVLISPSAELGTPTLHHANSLQAFAFPSSTPDVTALREAPGSTQDATLAEPDAQQEQVAADTAQGGPIPSAQRPAAGTIVTMSVDTVPSRPDTPALATPDGGWYTGPVGAPPQMAPMQVAWHEITAIPLQDPVLDTKVVLLTHTGESMQPRLSAG